MAAKKTPQDHLPKSDKKKAEETPSYATLEALEAEATIPDIEPFRACIAKDEDDEDVILTFRPYTEFSFMEMDIANQAEMNGDVLAYFKIALSAEDLSKVDYYGLRAYQMGLLMAQSQKYYNEQYGVNNPLGN